MPNIVIPYERRPEQRAIHQGLWAHRFGVVVAHRRMGKTVCMINHLIHEAVKDDQRAPHYAYVAPQLKQGKAIAWGYLKEFTGPIPGRKVNESELSVTLPNGAVVRIYGSDNPDSLRGLYFDGVVIDETGQIKPEAWTEVIRPALSDRMGWACFIGTPKGVNLFYELYLQALNTDGWYCEVFPASQTGIIPRGELATLQQEMSEAQYRQEFECDFTASDPDILIPLDLVQPCVERPMLEHEYRHAPILLGCDVGGEGEDATVLIVRQGLKLHHVEPRYGLNTMEVVNWVAQAYREWQCEAVFVDAIGLGAGVYDRLQQLGRYQVFGVKGSNKASEGRHHNLRMEMWYRMREWYDRGASIPRDQALIAGTTSPKFKADEVSGRLKLETKEHMREDRGLKSPDEADAVALTFAYPVDPGIEDDFDDYDEPAEVRGRRSITGYG